MNRIQLALLPQSWIKLAREPDSIQ